MILALALALALAAPQARAETDVLTLASTTSVRNSGLYDWLLPRIRAALALDVRVIAVGTGQAIRLARRGDADVLLVHDPPAERAFVAAGFGRSRRPVMYNYFVVIGPRADPAGVRRAGDASAALAAVARARRPFVSRGDNSGTHKMELRLWRGTGTDPAKATGGWYREVGAGMGAALNMAAAMGAYALTDKASWIAFANRSGLAILLSDAPALFNQYSLIAVEPARHPHVGARKADALIDWLTGPEGQAAIAAYRVAGRQLFFPNADGRGPTEPDRSRSPDAQRSRTPQAPYRAHRRRA